MTDAPTSRRAPNRQRWWIGALVASLAVNAFLVGAIATDFFDRHGRGRPVNFELRWLQGRLPDDGLAKVTAAVDATRPATEQHFARLTELRQQLGVLAASPTPDRAAIDAQLAGIRAELNTMLTEAQRTSIDAVLALPPEMRAKLGEPDKD